MEVYIEHKGSANPLEGEPEQGTKSLWISGATTLKNEQNLLTVGWEENAWRGKIFQVKREQHRLLRQCPKDKDHRRRAPGGRTAGAGPRRFLWAVGKAWTRTLPARQRIVKEQGISGLKTRQSADTYVCVCVCRYRYFYLYM